MREHVAGVDDVAGLYLECPGAQVRIGGEVSVAEILDDVIAGERLVVNRHCDLAAVWHVLGNSVLCLDDLSVRDRVNLLIPCVIAAILVLVAGERFAVVAKLNPVDRVTLANVRLSVYREHGAAMRRRVGRGVGSLPVLTGKGRADDDRIGLIQIEHGGVNGSGAAALAVLLDRDRGVERVGIALVRKPVGKDKENAGLPRLHDRIVGLGAIAARARHVHRGQLLAAGRLHRHNLVVVFSIDVELGDFDRCLAEIRDV